MFIRTENISKKFGDKTVIDNISLSIAENEFHVILGPSGEGKSVMLNLIAGLMKTDSGRIFLRNHDITRARPENRPVSMVFQDYALFPHLSVKDNIAFGMKTRKMSRSYIRSQVDKYINMVGMADNADKKPHALSGGQKQRTAIARALAAEPEIILYDEPLSHLDLTLQEQLIAELKELHENTGTTALYVTHNRNEALALADRITLLHNGRIEQTGSAEDIFYHPRTAFAASFVGASNIIECNVSENNSDRSRLSAGEGIEFAVNYYPVFDRHKVVRVCVHPEKISLSDYPCGDNCFKARIIKVDHSDVLAKIQLDIGGMEITAKIPHSMFNPVKQNTYVCFERNSITPLCGKTYKQNLCSKDS